MNQYFSAVNFKSSFESNMEEMRRVLYMEKL